MEATPLIRFAGPWQQAEQEAVCRAIVEVERTADLGRPAAGAAWICARHESTQLTLFVAQRIHLTGIARGLSPDELAEAVRRRWLRHA